MIKSNEIRKLYERSLAQAREKLREIEVFCNTDAAFGGLSGWVFEQTIQHCIEMELQAKGLEVEIRQQAPLVGRAKADLAVGSFAAIELKSNGIYSKDDIEKYKRYKQAALEKGFNRYLYLSWDEGYLPYKNGLNEALGEENVFYIENTMEWSRFISELTEGGDLLGQICKDAKCK